MQSPSNETIQKSDSTMVHPTERTNTMTRKKKQNNVQDVIKVHQNFWKYLMF